MSRMTDLVVLIRRATSSWVPPSAERTLSSYKKYLMPSMFCPLIQIGRLRILVLFQSDMTFYATSCCSDNSHYFFSYEGNSAELQGLEMSTFFFFSWNSLYTHHVLTRLEDMLSDLFTNLKVHADMYFYAVVVISLSSQTIFKGLWKIKPY